ncbi:MAG: response regulator [Clostridiales bacterium]|nr:response regulator [Clostridiales bacterium]
MREIIKTNRELCTGCNRCVRECPMELANITYLDEAGAIKVEIDNTKCIVCGRCLAACKHQARYYEDDIVKFFDDLSAGVPISLITAPAIRTNIPEYRRLFTYLKKLGVRKIYDVSLGADLCIWGHVRYIEKYSPGPLITQPCPVIVTYCEMYRHDLLKSLSPVHSPMGSLAVYMKEYEGVTDNIAALSPCIAKANEFEETKLADYNITFPRLIEHLEKNGIELPEEETGFDHVESSIGSLFPMPGGLKENIEFYMNKKVRISKAEGYNVYEKLDLFGETPEDVLPGVFDVLNCHEGCNIGPAATRKKNIFEIDSAMDKSRKAATDNKKREYFDALYKAYDEKLDLSRFLRKYEPIDTYFPQITENDISEAYKLLGKDDYAKQNIDCGACGSETCQQMAKRIALKVNISENCVVKSRDKAKEEHVKSLNTLNQFETVWNNVESCIIIIDIDTREVLDVNPAACRMYGGWAEMMIGKRCDKLFCGGSECPILDHNKNLDRAERSFVTAKGEVVPILKSVSRINYNGRKALLENFSDMSYIKEAEEQKRQLEVAEQASQAKSAFLANMSHEIRTPMNAIIGMTSIAKSADNVERKDYALGKIEDASHHLLGVINDILDVSKIEAGKFELSDTEFYFENMLKRVVTVNNFRIDEKHQKLTVHIDNAIPKMLLGDEQRLAQVITNLLSNAVKFTPEKGLINIDTQFLGEENGLANIRISVTDSGIGISPEQQSRLFQSFQQAESSTSRKFGGTGLGLAISKSIVEMMGGKIWIESELGKGATFAFIFQAEPVAEKQKTFPDWRSVRILAVDDDAITLEYCKDMVQALGAPCDIAKSGQEALTLARQNGGYDIYFVDWQMPGMDGMELTKMLKAEKTGLGQAYVVMMSAAEGSDVEEEAQKAGVDKLLAKPLFPSDIANAVNDLLGMALQEKKEERKGNSGQFEGYRILLAEDVEINREIVLALLEPTLISVDCAENGAEALRMFCAAPALYDAIFMDVQMPEMDGYEATRAIRALDMPQASSVPIIAMTANVFKEDVEKCLLAGMNSHVGKPLDFEEVLEKLSAYLPQDKQCGDKSL